MAWITQVFNAIVGAIVAALTMLKSIVLGVVELFAMLPSAVSMLSYSISMIPPVLFVFAVAFISASVVYLIIGR